MKYQKKPVVIDAFQYDGDLKDRYGDWYVPDWAVDAFENGVIFYDNLPEEQDGPPCELFIRTLEGVHHVSVGDYIIQGVKGELYPCKPDIFALTYEAPTVDPVRGRWVKRTNPQWPAYTHDVCSVCGWENSSKAAKYRDFPYCPNCGSRMDEDGGRKDG